MLMKLGTLVIADRRSIRVRDQQIDIVLKSESGSSSSDSAAQCGSGATGVNGGCVSPIKNKEVIFTLEFVGKVKSNQVLYDQFDDYFNNICNSNPQQWQRRVCDETTEELTIVSAYMRRQEMDKEMFGVRTGEVHLISAEFGAAAGLSFNLTFLPPSITA